MSATVRKSAASPVVLAGDDEFELATDINDAYRRTRMNVMYYGRRLATAQRWAARIDMAIAIGTSATIASLAVVHTPYGRVAFGVIVTAAAVLGAVKPAMKLPDKIARYGKLWAGYNAAYTALERATRDMRAHGAIRPEVRESASAAIDGYLVLASEEDPDPDVKLLKTCDDAVRIEIPKDRLWWPSDDEEPDEVTSASAVGSPVASSSASAADRTAGAPGAT